MSDGIEADFSELMALAADLGEIPTKAISNVKKAVDVTARNVKDDWRKNIGGSVGGSAGHAKRYPTSIFYDKISRDGEIGAEIGPELGRPGGSAGFLEDAPGDVRAAPQHAGRDAAKANEEDFVRGLTIAITEPLEG